MNDKILTLLGFASKSGNIQFGSDCVKTVLKEKKAKLVLLASDLSAKSEKEIRFAAGENVGLVFRVEYPMEVLSHATGRHGGVLAVTDVGFADAIRGGIANGKVKNQ